MADQQKHIEALERQLAAAHRALAERAAQQQDPAVALKLAVERMRSAAMAMRSSEDLQKLIGRMWQEIDDLGFNTWSASIRFIAADGSRVTNSYYAIPNPRQYGIKWTSPLLIEYNESRAVGRLDIPSPRDQVIIDAWRNKEALFVQGTPEDYTNRLQRMNDFWGLERPLPAPDASNWVFTYVPFEHGVISFLEHNVLEEQQQMVHQLAAALSLGYIRFLDFQQLEEQNKKLAEANDELVLEAALERVRAKALGMQKSDDLVGVSELLFEEYANQEIPLVRSSISVWDEDADQWRAWVTRKEGGRSAVHDMSLKLIFDNLPRYKTAYAAWKDGAPYHCINLSGQDRLHHFSTLKQFFNRPDTWLKDVLTWMPDPYIQNLVFFSHGYLQVDLDAALPEADIQIAKRFADVFGIAYRRYEELRQAEAARRQLETQNQALEENLRLLQEAQNQLVMQEKMASLGDLVAGVAHEMNPPLGSIRSMHDTLMRAIDKLQQRLDAHFPAACQEDKTVQAAFKVIADANQVIDSGAQRVNGIVSSLRNFARLDEAEFQVVDLHQGIDSALTLLEGQMGARITVVRDYGEIPPVHCAPGQLNQVFMHLLKNAIQAIEGPGQITVSSAVDGDQVCLRFADTGIGMAPEQVQRLFDFEFKAEDKRVKMGFGLAADWRTIQEHKGQLQVDSQLGAGTTVTVLLPAQS